VALSKWQEKLAERIKMEGKLEKNSLSYFLTLLTTVEEHGYVKKSLYQQIKSYDENTSNKNIDVKLYSGNFYRQFDLYLALMDYIQQETKQNPSVKLAEERLILLNELLKRIRKFNQLIKIDVTIYKNDLTQKLKDRINLKLLENDILKELAPKSITKKNAHLDDLYQQNKNPTPAYGFQKNIADDELSIPGLKKKYTKDVIDLIEAKCYPEALGVIYAWTELLEKIQPKDHNYLSEYMGTRILKVKCLEKQSKLDPSTALLKEKLRTCTELHNTAVNYAKLPDLEARHKEGLNLTIEKTKLEITRLNLALNRPLFHQAAPENKITGDFQKKFNYRT
jgi:hypothetical protein